MKRLASLEELYAAIPPTACKGLCWETCIEGVRAHPDELAAMRKLAGNRPIPSLGRGACKYLTVEHRCAVYEARPLVCRMYGATTHPMIACHHGCTEEPLDALTSTGLLVEYIMLRRERYEPI